MTEVVEDVSTNIQQEMRYAALPQHLRKVAPATDLTPARKRVLAMVDGLQLGYWSNAVVYAPELRRLNKADHKILLALVKGGQLRVLRKPGPGPSGGADYHYELLDARHIVGGPVL